MCMAAICDCDQHYVDEFSFSCPYKLTYIQDLAEKRPVVTEKNQVQASYVNDLGPRSRNDIEIQYSHIFINSISFRLQASIVSEKSTFFTFSYRKACYKI